MHILRDVMSRIRARDVTVMLGLRRKNTVDRLATENGDVARLFFDSFSKRVGIVEDGLKSMSTEVNKLKISMDRSQLSDLVLLERLQKTEALVRESLNWTKEAAEIWRQVNEMPAGKEKPPVVTSEASVGPPRIDFEEAALSRRVLAPVPELGTLPSITTPTELQVLTGIFSVNEVSKAFFASEAVNSRCFSSEIIVLASLSNFRGDMLSAEAVPRGVPAITSTRSSSLPTFSRVTCPSMVIECLTPSSS